MTEGRAEEAKAGAASKIIGPVDESSTARIGHLLV